MTLTPRTPGAHWHNHADPRFTSDANTLRRLRAALSRWRLQERPVAEGDPAPPIDVATISRTVDEALDQRTALPEREWVDATVFLLRGHLELLVREYRGTTDTAAVRQLHRDAYKLLELGRRFGADTPPLHLYELMLALATTAHAFLALHQRGRA
ncbi:DUF6415 family natural product biosynthesis protein [Streptomyces sp. NPDC050509]|uniref:DUF6415 family natural product biosynthesis protein n=1 Tax=Streptomyces sp. NPDC050509 TaxID=3365620 RepID=UPI00379281F4